MRNNRPGLLPWFVFATLVIFYCVWACMHDIAHGDEGTGEWTVLAICAPAFALMYWQALRVLTSNAKVAWLIINGLLITLFSAGSVSSMSHPKYPKDPMLGATFLAAGLPTLALIGYHLIREALRNSEQPSH